MKKVMAVYDTDPFYAERFADFINRREKIPMAVMAFTSMERLKKYGETHDIEILLVSSQADKKAVEDIKAAQVVVLSDGSPESGEEDYPAVYKYQSSDKIIREVMACYGEEAALGDPYPLMGTAKILCVYSPVNRCQKTSFALTLGQILAEEDRTLYINLEDFSGMSALMNEMFTGSISDLLYYYRQGQCSWARLSSMIYTWGDLDYIPPARYPEDLSQTEGTYLAGFLSDLAKTSVYRMIVVDAGQSGKTAVDIMEVCDVVYMPVPEDFISQAKIGELEKYLEVSGRGYLAGKIRKLRLPARQRVSRETTFIKGLAWSELGDYVRSILKGGGYDGSDS